MQKTFCSADYGFKWTNDNWYEWDAEEGRKQAMRARNAEVKRLRAEGKKVTTFSMSSQLISRGGIGSGRPHIELIANVYGFNSY